MDSFNLFLKLSNKQLKIISNFFLDGAKIIFGSLVVGVFVPGISTETPWHVFIAGITLTLMLLIFSVYLIKKL